MDRYKELSDEEKIALSIDFVARSTPIPEPLRDFLRAEGLLTAIEAPGEKK